MKHAIALGMLVAYAPIAQARTKSIESISSWIKKNVTTVLGTAAIIVGAGIYAAKRNNNQYNPIRVEPLQKFSQQQTNDLFELIVWPGEGNPNTDAIKALFTEGANPNGRFLNGLPTLQKTYGEQSPLWVATRYEAPAHIIQLLIDNGAQIDETKDGRSLIEIATRHNPQAIPFLQAKLNGQNWVEQPLVVPANTPNFHTPMNRKLHQPPNAPKKVPLNLLGVNNTPIPLLVLPGDDTTSVGSGISLQSLNSESSRENEEN